MTQEYVNYYYSLYDKIGKEISPNLFSKAVYYNIWYNDTLKVYEEMFPPFKAREKQQLILDHIDHISLIRRKINKKAQIKRKSNQAKKKAKKKIIEQDKELPKSKKTKFKETKNFFIREKFKKLESSNIELNTYMAKIFSFKFKDMLYINIKNEHETDLAIEALRNLYNASFPIVYKEANKRKLKDHKNKFIAKILLAHFDEDDKIIKDKVLKTFEVDEIDSAINYAKRKKDVDIKEKRVMIRKTKEYEDKLLVIQKQNEDTPLEDMFDFSAISTVRYQAFSTTDGDHWFEQLLKAFKKKTEEYLSRAYAVRGAVVGLNIEYIFDYNIQ